GHWGGAGGGPLEGPQRCTRQGDVMDLTFNHRRAVAGAISALSIATLALVSVGDGRVAAQSPSCLVNTASGPVQGALRGGTCTYLGIPYAAPPVGNLRWRPPQPRAPWAPSTLTASLVRQCPQLNLNTGALAGDEDCLLLNVWAPAASLSARTPVIVWLHTGGFQAANANFAASDGARFAAERDAIVVAPNYRLGPLGFLAHSALSAEDPTYPTSGNYGLADQRAALRWVRDHIAAFGGDPDNVTLAGTSAGAESTSLHLISPASRRLFHRAIMQSGNASARLITASEAGVQGEAFAAALGCTNRGTVLSCMRAAARDQVLRALAIGQSQFLESDRVEWRPSVDGVEIPDQPRALYRRGQFSRVPIIIGVNGDEGWTFVDRSFPAGLDAVQYDRAVRGEFGMDADAILRLYPAVAFPTPKDALARLTGDADYVCEARRIARVMHHDGAPVYLYSFEYPLEGVAGGRAIHGLESNFLFGNTLAANPNLGIPSARALTAADLVVYDVMSTYWRRFAATGDPNPRGQPVQWPPYRPGPYDSPVDPSQSDRYFTFGDRLGVNTYLRDQQCNFWESFFFRSVLGVVPAAAR
ncbi:MAG: carboxylesterase/lipase family protein, partial [Acidobacteriota bacterium]